MTFNKIKKFNLEANFKNPMELIRVYKVCVMNKIYSKIHCFKPILLFFLIIFTMIQCALIVLLSTLTLV